MPICSEVLRRIQHTTANTFLMVALNIDKRDKSEHFRVDIALRILAASDILNQRAAKARLSECSCTNTTADVQYGTHPSLLLIKETRLSPWHRQKLLE